MTLSIWRGVVTLPPTKVEFKNRCFIGGNWTTFFYSTLSSTSLAKHVGEQKNNCKFYFKNKWKLHY